ncbi:TylF/MycF/NovP-related O-methyltransferase [Streptomyces sirii]|uniref:TylF/MycF/NovP-related O-methyltransferase n=1 Tax=Streptomyces sirii TaxID=3127701 RepID=UPI003D366991
MTSSSKDKPGSFDDVRFCPPNADIDSLTDADREIIYQAEPYTLTGLARLHALVISVRHLIAADIPGAFAECGVWRGGSVLAIAATLKSIGVTDRDIYLYDTFEGMTAPDQRDTSPFDGSAVDLWEHAQASGKRMWASDPSQVGEEAVRSIVLSSGYPAGRLHFVRGPVQETLPKHAPDLLALLRLDTDWYDSTKHEMSHLYPCLAPGGVLIIDDYGHWEGQKQAIDEYFAHDPVLLSRVDYACRLAVKPR